MKNNIGWRQIHLDFHTHPSIPDVGGAFDPEEFAHTLAAAHVDSINLFARGHHGMLYYQSERFPERVHPGLAGRNLLKEQAEACRRRGIHVNAYTTLNWDLYTVRSNPGWVCIDAAGRLADHNHTPYLQPGFYINLCANTDYRQFMREHIAEMLAVTEFDGVWIDANFLVECCCPTCLQLMREKGYDPLNPAHRARHAVDTNHDITRFLTSVIRGVNPDLQVLYNKSHVGFVDRPVAKEQTYFAFESLPGGDWGYLDFPVAVRYNRGEGIPTAGVTGRFHTSWGDTHSYRNEAALEYECFSMLAQGAHCIIGDQLHPSGRLDAEMYERIGRVYASVAEKQPWCEGAVPETEIAVISGEEYFGAGVGELPRCDAGACQMLTELAWQFDFVDSGKDLSAYALVILPDVIPVDEAYAKKLEAYVANGGKLLVTAESGLNPATGDFALSSLGLRHKGSAPFAPTFIIPRGETGRGLPEREHVLYLPGQAVEALPGTQVLQEAVEPYFNRTWEHFSSHFYTPSAGAKGGPAITLRGGCAYFAHPVFEIYQQYAPAWCKKLVGNVLGLLLPERKVTHDGPSTLQVSLLRQEAQQRRVVHLLHYIHQRRCERLDIIEDRIPLYHIQLNLSESQPHRVRGVRRVPSGEAVPFRLRGNILQVDVQEVVGHEMLEIQYE